MPDLKHRDPIKLAVADAAFESIESNGIVDSNGVRCGQIKTRDGKRHDAEATRLGDMQMQMRVKTDHGPRYFLIKVTEQL